MDWLDVSNWLNRENSNVEFGNVVGVTFVEGYPNNLIRLMKTLYETMEPISAEIRRNPKNEYDSNACEVWVDKEMIGHLPKELAATVAPKIDSGILFNLDIVSMGFANQDPTKPGARFHLEQIKE